MIIKLKLFYFLLFFLPCLSGCFAVFEAAELAEASSEVASAAGERGLLEGGLEGLTEVEIAEFSSEGVFAEDITAIKNSIMEIRNGKLMSAESNVFNNELSKIKITRNGGGNPLLHIEGYDKPFGEVYPEKGFIKFYALNEYFPIRNNIFSVEGENVNVINESSNVSSNIVTVIHKGDLVVRLYEQDGWYRVNVLENGNKLSGFVDPMYLAPLILGGAKYDSTTSPYEVILKEEDARRNFSFYSTDEGSISSQDAMYIIFDELSFQKANRKISYNFSDWQDGITDFLKMGVENLPILSEPNFEVESLKIIGFTKIGELLQFITLSHEGVKIRNPLSRGPDNFGDWTQIKTLDGEIGWILTKPFDQDYLNGSLIKRVITVKQSIQYSQTKNENKNEEENKPFQISIGIILLIVVALFLLIFIISR